MSMTNEQAAVLWVIVILVFVYTLTWGLELWTMNWPNVSIN
jgi:hypothetical protein